MKVEWSKASEDDARGVDDTARKLRESIVALLLKESIECRWMVPIYILVCPVRQCRLSKVPHSFEDYDNKSTTYGGIRVPLGFEEELRWVAANPRNPLTKQVRDGI